MWNYRVRAIFLTGIVCIFAVWTTPVRSQEQAEPEPEAAKVEEVQSEPTGDPQAATTTKELDIPVDELKILVKPLTLTELQNEAAGWMVLVQTKAKEISQAEVAIKRQNLAITQQEEGAKALEEAQKALEEAEKIQDAATPGASEHEEGAKKVEEAKEKFKQAQEAVEEANTTKQELKEDEALQGTLEKAKETGDLEQAKQTLEETQKARDQMVAGSLEYDETTKTIDKLEAAIKAFEDAHEAQTGAQPDSPEYEQATQQVDAAQGALKQLLKELGVGAKEQSSQDLDKATATLKNTEIDHSGEDQVAGSPGVVNSQQKLEKQQQDLENTTEQLEKSVDAASEAKNDLVVTVTELHTQLTAINDRFNVILDELEKKGGKADFYRQYIQAVTALEVDTQDTEGLGLRLIGWAKSDEGGLRWASNAGKFLGVLVVSVIVTQIFGALLNRLLSRFDGISALMRNFIVMTVTRGGVVVGFLLALTALEVSLGPILALVGGVSFVLAFALQNNLGNLVSGLMIMVYKPFDVGDEIKVIELWGCVESITLANTKIKGLDGQVFTVPNNTIWGETIENMSYGSTRKFTQWFRIGFDEDLVKVEQLLVEIMTSHPNILTDPAPTTQVWSIEDYYISVKAHGWVKRDDFWAVNSDIIRMVRTQFDKEGIKLAAIPTGIEIEGHLDRNGVPDWYGKTSRDLHEVELSKDLQEVDLSKALHEIELSKS
jgi:small conductance mechanosensitive channel